MAGIDLNDTGGKVEEDLNDLPCYTYCKSLSLPFRIGLWKLVRVRPLLPPSPSMSLCISADLFRKVCALLVLMSDRMQKFQLW